MVKRYVAIWFPYLLTDRLAIRQPELRGEPFVLTMAEKGRMLIRAVSQEAEAEGIKENMVLADAKALFPNLLVFDFDAAMSEKLLRRLGEWCLRYTPLVSVDVPDGLLLDVSGCTHLWKGEGYYLKEITTKMKAGGYHVRAAMADTPGIAWAVSRYGKEGQTIVEGELLTALLPLPPAALRLDDAVTQRMYKLGMRKIRDFIHLPATTLRRRFGQQLLDRIGQALGTSPEYLEPVCPVVVYQERLPCMEPVRTRKAIELALDNLLETLTARLFKEGQGLRKAVFKSFRMDGKVQEIAIGTNRPSRDRQHLVRLFNEKIAHIAPGLGIELFVLEAPVVEELHMEQERLWNKDNAFDRVEIGHLLDRIAGRMGEESIRRYLPDEHHWPERGVKRAASLEEQPSISWPTERPRPTQLLTIPQPIEVTVPIPDYPPMLFRYKGETHMIKKADGPERIEREWWMDQGEHRDYYYVEDEKGRRYWLFRLGHYSDDRSHQWYLHGYFA
ncbi:DNA polymerase Y family protein [Sphingobacterium olei]|uniref:DNA polymerase Y family protein n=1 Tax=Sphingobacterium olei TaxID=2571155 RepID=A0A4U0PJW5_9SPHI|nr:DNA polymerase Y family protein [Sphingobacterium olei]TJZ63214.1 DNA polymerase Y family protein [Sphingobacterium olei]